MTVLTIPLEDDQLHFVIQAARNRGLSVEQFLQQTIVDCCRQAADEVDVRAMYPQIAKVFGPAGWDDPEMDSYNQMDPRRQP